MPNPFFEFKQYKIYHDKCGMKITQDASIFGASIVPNCANKIIDIGCGSGILSIMLAQKTNTEIIALDIDKGAIEQTKYNVKNSPYNNIRIVQSAIQEFEERDIDLIITNPPYYTDQDSKTGDNAYNKARHANTSLTFQDLATHVNRLLSIGGKFWFILPIYEVNKLLKECEKNELYLNKRILVKHNETAKNGRIIAQLSRVKSSEIIEEILLVRNEDNSYTEAFKELLKDYYIKF